MGRLIDADALSAKLEAECREWEGESAYQAGLCAAAAMVAEAPTAERAPVMPRLRLGSGWWCGECNGQVYVADKYCCHCGRRIDWT